MASAQSIAITCPDESKLSDLVVFELREGFDVQEGQGTGQKEYCALSGDSLSALKGIQAHVYGDGHDDECLRCLNTVARIHSRRHL